MKWTEELVVGAVGTVLWIVMGVTCLFWDLPAGEMAFGGIIFHLGFYALSLLGVVVGFFTLLEKADDIADWLNSRGKAGRNF